jgi:Ca2+-binding RTX toxin-like protein
MTFVTVSGGSGTTISVPFTSLANAQVAQAMLGGISAAVDSGTIAPYEFAGHGRPNPPPGPAMMVLTGPGAVTVPAGTGTLVDISARHDVIFGGAAPSQLVVSGLGGITYFANTGSGTVIAGGGNNTILVGGPAGEHGPGHGERDDDGWRAERASAPTVGAHLILTSDGNDKIFALSGDVTIGAGLGHNLIRLGDGTASVSVTGDDTIRAGSGAATVDATTGTALVLGGSGDLTFVGGSEAATVLGGAGSVSAMGGAGGGLFEGGTAGNNLLQGGDGAVTLFGGGSGDHLTASPLAGSMLTAGQGNETLTGGAGSDVFAFLRSLGGGHDVIAGFTPGADALELLGYGRNAFAKALGTASQDASGTTITLSDHTTLTFVGLSMSDLQTIKVLTIGGDDDHGHGYGGH